MNLKRATATMTLLLTTMAGTVAGAAAGAAGAAGAVETVPSYRLANDVVPQSEAISLRLDPGQDTYSGTVRIELRVKQPAASFRFHASRMKLGKLELRAGTTLVPTRLTQEGVLATVTTDKPLAVGSYTLTMSFDNEFGRRAVGLYKMTQQGQSYAFSQFESADARQAFPCWDEPLFKIPFQLTLEIPAALEAVTGTPLRSQKTAGAWKTLVFEPTKPLPSYLLAIAVGPLEFVPIPGLGMPGRVVTPRGQQKLSGLATELTAPILHALEAYFGSRYPYEKLDLIAVPEYWPGAMENPGAITYSDGLLLVDPQSSGPRERRALANVTAHELAHMWFGDLVTMAWWDDLWLNESFADWMGDKITGQLYPQYHLELSEMQSIQGIMNADARPTTESIRQEVKVAEQALNHVGLDYAKGKAVLRMFEQFVGPDKFRAGINDYLKAHAFGNATAADLWAALSKATGQDIAPAMATFLDQPGLPLITAQLLPGGKVKLSQRRFANAGVSAPAQLWRVPVGLKFSDGKKVQHKTVLLDSAEKIFDLGGAVSWILPNAEGSGYYRFTLERPQLLRLAEVAGKELAPRERISFIGDLAALLDAGVLHGDDYLAALAHFADDPVPQVISSLLNGLGKVRTVFVTDALKPRYAAYIRRTLAPAKARFGLTRKTGEEDSVTLFRPRLIEVLGQDGEDPEVVAFATAAARKYLTDMHSGDASLIEPVLQVAAEHGDRALFDELRGRFETAKIPQERRYFLGALGGFRTPELMDEALRYSLSDKVRPTEMFTVAFNMTDTAGGRDRVFAWATKNYATITARMPTPFVSQLPHMASGCEEPRLVAAQAFFTERSHQVEGTLHELAKVAEQVRDCSALRSRESKAVNSFLTAPAK
jgi:alanyl aminopeptidase